MILTAPQAAALAALAALDLQRPGRAVAASQVAWRMYPGPVLARGRGPGGRPAAAARCLDALADKGLAFRDWDRTTYQRLWYITAAGTEAAAQA